MGLDYSSPGISFDLKNGRIFVYKTTAEAIGHPEYARFMFSPEDRVFGNQYHQLCWWSVFAPPGLTGAFPPKGGLANRSYITGGRLKAAPFLTTFRDLLPVDPFRTVLQYTS